MTISNPKFAAELVTAKGRVYTFDDISCLLLHRKENTLSHISTCYISNFLAPNKLVRADSLYYLQGENIGSPMGGNIAAFTNSDSASYYAEKLGALPITWVKLSQ